jgi:endonuclease III
MKWVATSCMTRMRCLKRKGLFLMAIFFHAWVLISISHAVSLERFQVLCSLVLSAQSKDECTKASMDNLRGIPGGLTPENLLALDVGELKKHIRPSGLYEKKASYLRSCASQVIENNGEVPDTMESMMKLHGVGSKIASLAMSACWGKDVSIGVDVHVNRISQRLGWVKSEKNKDANKTQKELEEWLPRELWRPINTSFVGLGQTICEAKNPKCAVCPAKALCPSSTAKK